MGAFDLEPDFPVTLVSRQPGESRRAVSSGADQELLQQLPTPSLAGTPIENE